MEIGLSAPWSGSSIVAPVEQTGSDPSGKSTTDRSGVRSKAGRPILVLVVDDGPDARDLYRACLEFHGVVTECAEDGAAGIAMALAIAPDAIVLDFSMPKMDGAEVLQRLRADAKTCDIPVIMITAVPELVPAATRAACDTFLEKPCEPDRLINAVARIAMRDGGRAVRPAAPSKR